MHEGNTVTICNGQEWTQIQHKSIPNLGHFKSLIIQLIEFKQTTIHMPGRRTQSLQREKQGRQQTDRQPAGTHSDGSLGYWGRDEEDRSEWQTGRGGARHALLETPREHFLLSECENAKPAAMKSYLQRKWPLTTACNSFRAIIGKKKTGNKGSM